MIEGKAENFTEVVERHAVSQSGWAKVAADQTDAVLSNLLRNVTAISVCNERSKAGGRNGDVATATLHRYTA